MAKIPNHVVTDILIDEDYYPDAWWDYQNDMDNMLARDAGDYSWQWRMEVSIRKNEGWFLYTAPKFSDTLSIFSWLDDNDVQFKSEDDQFLIKDEQWVTALALLWG
jgi:hypothetical protein